MPLGLFLLLMTVLLLALGRGELVSDAMALPRRGAAAVLSAWIVSYLLPPYAADGVEAYWLPFFLITAFVIYLGVRLEHKTRTFLCTLLAAAVLFLLSLALPVQPTGLLYEPLALFALALALLVLLFARDVRGALFLSLAPFLLFHTALLFTGRLTVLMPADLIAAVFLSSALALPPVKFLQAHRLKPYRRVFQTEAGKSFIKERRKRFKK